MNYEEVPSRIEALEQQVRYLQDEILSTLKGLEGVYLGSGGLHAIINGETVPLGIEESPQ